MDSKLTKTTHSYLFPTNTISKLLELTVTYSKTPWVNLKKRSSLRSTINDLGRELYKRMLAFISYENDQGDLVTSVEFSALLKDFRESFHIKSAVDANESERYKHIYVHLRDNTQPTTEHIQFYFKLITKFGKLVNKSKKYNVTNPEELSYVISLLREMVIMNAPTLPHIIDVPFDDEHINMTLDVSTGMFHAKLGRKKFKAKMYDSIVKQIEKYKEKLREKNLKPGDLIEVISNNNEEGYYDPNKGKLYRADCEDKLEPINVFEEGGFWCKEEDMETVKELHEQQKEAETALELAKQVLGSINTQIINLTVR